jgi:hypothetical protein
VVCHCGDPGLIQDKSIWDLLWPTWHWESFSPRPLSPPSPPVCITPPTLVHWSISNDIQPCQSPASLNKTLPSLISAVYTSVCSKYLAFFVFGLLLLRRTVPQVAARNEWLRGNRTLARHLPGYMVSYPRRLEYYNLPRRKPNSDTLVPS